ncbi:MAG: zinc-ribbon domain-containing protein [Coriobacteriales bacterium]|jgi:hypothetical protein|nr:zinc-ribbon domain-containing protein [Coriobacteriales bacterium]
MFCLNCGKEIEPSSKFCVYCGERVPVDGNDAGVEQVQSVPIATPAPVEVPVAPSPATAPPVIQPPAPSTNNTSTPQTSQFPHYQQPIATATGYGASLPQQQQTNKSADGLGKIIGIILCVVAPICFLTYLIMYYSIIRNPSTYATGAIVWILLAAVLIFAGICDFNRSKAAKQVFGANNYLPMLGMAKFGFALATLLSAFKFHLWPWIFSNIVYSTRLDTSTYYVVGYILGYLIPIIMIASAVFLLISATKWRKAERKGSLLYIVCILILVASVVMFFDNSFNVVLFANSIHISRNLYYFMLYTMTPAMSIMLTGAYVVLGISMLVAGTSRPAAPPAALYGIPATTAPPTPVMSATPVAAPPTAFTAPTPAAPNFDSPPAPAPKPEDGSGSED